MVDLRRKLTPAERVRELEERERIAAKLAEDLPAGVCSVCGGTVAAGTGTLQQVSAWANFADVAAWREVDMDRVGKGLPPLLGWRRRHAGCQTSADIVATLTGVEVSPVVAADALGRLKEPVRVSELYRSEIAAHRAMVAGYVAWGHVEEHARTLLRRAVDRARAEVEPRRCREGGCAWCGRSHSIGWRSSPERWGDGSDAPLCTSCAKFWDLGGRPTDRDGLRACALEALSGANSWGSNGLGIRTYSDLATDDHAGTAEPWTYAPDALAALRERAWMTWPGSLTGVMRDEYTARARREHAEAQDAALARLAADEAEASAEAAAAEGWPLAV